MSQTKVSNIESGKLTPTAVDVELIIGALDVSGPEVADILALVRTANTEWQDDWSSRRRGLDKKQNELARLEAASTEFRFFLLSAITGLLATRSHSSSPNRPCAGPSCRPWPVTCAITAM